MSLPPLDRDESRYLEASRQMVDSGDLVDIRFQDRPRYLQPAGIYWLESGAVGILRGLTGTPALENRPWAYRIPSLLAGVGNVLLTASIGTALFGPEAGLLAGLAFGGSVLAVAEGHLATIDTVLLFAILVAMRALASVVLELQAGRPARGRTAAIYWVAIGCGLMLKGPVGLIPCLGTPLALCLIGRDARLWRALRPSLGIPLALLVVLPWSVAILVRTHGAFFASAVGTNLLGKVAHGQQAHGAPPGTYLAMFPATFWPGFVFAALALPFVRAGWRDPRVRFLSVWALVQFAVFEAIATKLPHYVLPAFPAIACLVGAALCAPARPVGRVGAILGGAAVALWFALGLAACASGPVLLWVLEHAVSAGAIAASVLGVVLLAASLRLLLRRRRVAAFLAAIACAAVLYAGSFEFVIPALDTIWLSPRIAHTVAMLRPCPDSVLASASDSEPSLVFLAGRDTRLLLPSDAAAFLASDPACGLALVDRRDLDAFRANLTVPVRKLAEIDGVNTANGRHLHLSLFAASHPR